MAFVAFGLLASDVGFRILAFVGFCWLFAFVGFLLLLAFVGFWMWFHFAFGFWPGFLRVGFSWLLLFWLRWAFLRDTPFC